MVIFTVSQKKMFSFFLRAQLIFWLKLAVFNDLTFQLRNSIDDTTDHSEWNSFIINFSFQFLKLKNHWTSVRLILNANSDRHNLR